MPFRRTPFTGFPFDETDPDQFMRFRNNSQRSHIDDIAARHPEFAEYLRPWGTEFSNRNTRKRHPSGSCGDDDIHSQASGSSNESGNPSFPSRDYDRRSIFDSEFGFPEHIRRRFENLGHPRTASHENPNFASQTNPRPRTPKANQKSEKTNLPQYGLRNTVDLGQKQKQESFDEGVSRGQRSMSAPPDNRSNQPQQRFISRINIEPVNPDTVSQPQQQQHSSTDMGGNSSSSKPPKQPNVRHIPIFVEGRDEPVLPKNVNTDYTPPPNKDEYFNKDPSVFTQFLHRDQPHKQQQQQQTPPMHQQGFHQQQPTPPHSQHIPSETLQQPESQQRATSPRPQILNPIEKIQAIQRDVSELMNQVDTFTGSSGKDKQYLYLDEMLTRNLLKLDDIDTEGKENIRQARKEAIKCIEKCIGILEAKVDAMKALKENELKENETAAKVDEQKSEELAPDSTTDKVMDVQENSTADTENASNPPTADNTSEKETINKSESELQKSMSEKQIPMEVEQKTDGVEKSHSEPKLEVDSTTANKDNTDVKSPEVTKMETDESNTTEVKNTQQMQTSESPSQQTLEENKNVT